ncbi:MAG: DUF6036 family nucleotidyltransferase [Defluviitaleaceae bacterium]|nr:DUF6036 family nucleotidyltransferase [Defluviitaleaceae bacterium]
MLKNDLKTALHDTEILTKALGFPPFELYLLGGSGGILAGYLTRATRDFDIVDLDYGSSIGRVLKPLEPYDMIDLDLAVVPPSFKDRAVLLPDFDFLRIYVLSREDIIVSKLGRLNERDFDDIKIILPQADLHCIVDLINEVLAGKLLPIAKKTFINNAITVMEACDVQDIVQQLKKLRQGA